MQPADKDMRIIFTKCLIQGRPTQLPTVHSAALFHQATQLTPKAMETQFRFEVTNDRGVASIFSAFLNVSSASILKHSTTSPLYAVKLLLGAIELVSPALCSPLQYSSASAFQVVVTVATPEACACMVIRCAFFRLTVLTTATIAPVT